MTTIDQMLDFVQRNNVRRSKKIVTYAGHCSALEKRATTFIFTPDTDFVRRIYVRRSKKLVITPDIVRRPVRVLLYLYFSLEIL